MVDRATHAFIRELLKLASSSLTPGLTKNADGSIDIYFGPKAPVGKESNWVPTKRVLSALAPLNNVNGFVALMFKRLP